MKRQICTGNQIPSYALKTGGRIVSASTLLLIKGLTRRMKFCLTIQVGAKTTEQYKELLEFRFYGKDYDCRRRPARTLLPV
jgi:hypothetical protein